MKKTLLVRLLTFLLLLTMTLSIFAACGSNEETGIEPETYGESEEKGETTKPLKPPVCDFDFPPRPDYGGYEFTFLCQYPFESGAYYYNYLVSDGETQHVVLDAVYRRNELLKEKYNINFGQREVADIVSTVRAQVLGGVNGCDLIIADGKTLSTMAREGLLLDLASVESFDMTKEYWDSNSAEQLKIGDKLYFTNCPLNIEEVACVVYFNKKIISDYGLTSPYEYMDNNEWTLDNWAKLAMSVSEDINKDGEMTEVDRYGTLFDSHNGKMFLYGTGARATTNDEAGYPKVTLFADDRAPMVYEKCRQVFSAKSSWSIDDMDSSDTHGYNDKWDYARSLFCQDLYLFHYEGTNIIAQFLDMESDFGVVPFPKYDSDQESYYSLYPSYCSLVAMPKVNENLERSARIIEDLNFYSNVILKPAWYERLLQRMYIRDDESERSLDLILAGRVYDIGMYYDFGGIRSQLLDVDVRNSNISTMYPRMKKRIEADIKATYRDFGFEC